jgi:hypothetical protein
MRAGTAWVLALALGCSSNETSATSDGGASGANDGGMSGASDGGTSGANDGGMSIGGGGGVSGAAADGGEGNCATTLDARPEPIFEQTTSRLRLWAIPNETIFEGAVLDGQRREIHTEAERSGNCRLLTYESAGSFCDPLCYSPDLCVNGVCERFPSPVSAGTMSIELSEQEPFELEPKALGNYAWNTEDFGYDVVTSVAVTAAGGKAGAGFELEARLSPAPEPTSDWTVLAERRAPGEDLALGWSNPVDTARFYLRMTTCIGTHGGISPVEIECEGPDTGELTIPGAYLDALYAQGWGHGECGVNTVWRYHASQTGCGDSAVQLRAESSASFYLNPGFE